MAKNRRGRPTKPAEPIFAKAATGRIAEDCDYIKKLSKEELTWFRKFEREYYRGDGLKPGDKPLHASKQQLKELRAETRRAKQDIRVTFGNTLHTASSDSPEDALINLLDSKDLIKAT